MRAPTELHPAPILERHIRSAEQERTYWVALPAMMVAGVPTFALAMMGAHPVLAAGILMGLTLLLVKATMIVWPPRHRVGWQPVPWMVDEHGVTLGGQAARSVYAPAPDANDPTTAVYVAPWEAISDVHLITHRDILAGMAQHAWARPHRRRHGQGALFAPYFPHPRAPMLVFRVDLAKARMPSLPPGVQPSEVWAIPVADRFEVRRRFAEHGVVVCRRPVIMVPLASAGRRRVHVDVSTTPPKRFPRSARRDLARRRQEAEAAVARRASHPLSAGTAPAVVEDRVVIDDLGITLGRGDVTGAGLSDQPSPAVWDVLCHAPLGALRDVQLVRSTWRLFRLQRNGVGGAVVLNEGRWVVNRPSFRWWRVQGALTFRVDPGRGYIPPELPAWVQRSDVWMVPVRDRELAREALTRRGVSIIDGNGCSCGGTCQCPPLRADEVGRRFGLPHRNKHPLAPWADDLPVELLQPTSCSCQNPAPRPEEDVPVHTTVLPLSSGPQDVILREPEWSEGPQDRLRHM